MKNIAVLVYDLTVEYNIVVTDGITKFFKDKDDVHVIISTTSSPHNERFQYEYQYCLNISYNEEGTAGKGSAIFLHCLGNRKPRTGGCVAIPEEQMYFVMQHVDPDCVVVIDSMENFGAEF